MTRSEAFQAVLSQLTPDDRCVSALGFISRDFYRLTPEVREQCFYCQGSMGSVIPFCLGISLAAPKMRVFAIEGDGSLLMNLGALATISRYPNDVNVLIFDNGCYESTGGQISKPVGLNLARVIESVGIPTSMAASPGDVQSFMTRKGEKRGPAALVVTLEKSAPAPRITEPLETIAQRFSTGIHPISFQ